MKNYLRQTDGSLQTGTREKWDHEKCRHMLSHNNGAERPFAILRAYKHLYPSLSLANLGKLSQSIVNGTHRPRHNGLSAGIALTADPRLRTCVTQLCSVRRVKVGEITAYVRGEIRADANEARVVRKRKAKER
jgi:hypothetical protein